MELGELRRQIDAIDDQLVELFCRRMNLSAQVADYKKANGLPIFVPAREQQILDQVSEISGEEMAGYTRALYSMLFELSRSYQNKRINEPTRMKCGLQGRKLGHSYSPAIHAMLGGYPYALFEKEPEDLADFVKNGDFSGINVTIPYKKDVIPYLQELTPIARKMGAVNTVIRREDGSLLGHNTDYFGFLYMVRRLGIEIAGKKVLLLGSGGASNTALAVLTELGARVVVISRNGGNNYANLHLHSDAAVIVNTTPVGMYPATGVSPVSLEQFPGLEAVLDVIYNPARTRLLLDAEKLGIPCLNGLWMLVAQAKEAAEYFMGKSIDDSEIPRIYHSLKQNTENIALIGMPGCGKSTVGRLLAQARGYTFVDADAKIEVLAGKTIPEIFAQDGEDAFRKLETIVLSQIGKESRVVIATGGGCVTRAENYSHLHQNGKIVWLKRDPDLLPKDGRPLSLSADLNVMYQKREPMYRDFADIAVENSGTPEETVKMILNALEGIV